MNTKEAAQIVDNPPPISSSDRDWAIQRILKRKEHQRQYYLEHQEERRQYARARTESHPEKVSERNRKHYNSHEDKLKQYRENRKEIKAHQDKAHYASKRDSLLQQSREYVASHKDQRRAYRSKYNREHPEARKASSHKRRAKLTNSNGHFTTKEFRLLCETYENKCFYCKQTLPLTPDHATPLSRGGSNSIENIVPACLSCNASKGGKTLQEFVALTSTPSIMEGRPL